MIRTVSPAALAASVLAVGFAAFAAGFAVSSAFPMAQTPVRPIVNPNAWNEVAEVQPVSQSTPASRGHCSQWQMTDVAMEEVLDEMIRRGWRAPAQGVALASLDPGGALGLSAIDPGAPMPSRQSFNATGEKDTEALPTDETRVEETHEPANPDNEQRLEPPPA